VFVVYCLSSADLCFVHGRSWVRGVEALGMPEHPPNGLTTGPRTRLLPSPSYSSGHLRMLIPHRSGHYLIKSGDSTKAADRLVNYSTYNPEANRVHVSYPVPPGEPTYADVSAGPPVFSAGSLLAGQSASVRCPAQVTVVPPAGWDRMVRVPDNKCDREGILRDAAAEVRRYALAMHAPS
jgi:hypothetical protein